MAITTFDQYIGAYKQHIQISKSGAVTTTAGNWATTVAAAGFPGAGAAPSNTTTGVVPTDATTGFPTIQAFNGSNKGYLSRVEAFSPVNQTLALFDVIFWAGPTTIPTSGTTTVTLGTQPSFTGRLPFRSDGTTPAYEEVEMWVWLSTAGSNHAHTFQMSYKDQDVRCAGAGAFGQAHEHDGRGAEYFRHPGEVRAKHLMGVGFAAAGPEAPHEYGGDRTRGAGGTVHQIAIHQAGAVVP
jgi:hypothetical protein